MSKVSSHRKPGIVESISLGRLILWVFSCSLGEERKILTIDPVCCRSVLGHFGFYLRGISSQRLSLY